MSHSDRKIDVLDGAAPLGCARQASVMRERTRRLRRRGPRSQFACLRRSVSKHHRTLPGMSPGESGDAVADSDLIRKSLACRDVSRNDVNIYCLNVQCLLAHLAEVTFHLELRRPHVAMFQETCLDQSHDDVILPRYILVSRRDRSLSANRGGVATYRQEDFNGVVHINE